MSAFKSHQMLNSSRIRLRHSRLRRSCLKSQVAKSGRTELLLVDPAVKINGAFYRDPCFVARDLSWPVPYLRQNSTHGARDNSLLERQTAAFVSSELRRPRRSQLCPVLPLNPIGLSDGLRRLITK